MTQSFMPQTASTRDVQRDFSSIRKRAITYGSVVILSRQKADVALVDIELLDELQQLRKRSIEWEWTDTMEAIRIAEEEEKNGTLRVLHHASDLL